MRNPPELPNIPKPLSEKGENPEVSVNFQFIGDALEQIRAGELGTFIVIKRRDDNGYVVFLDAKAWHMDLVRELQEGRLVAGELSGSGGIVLEKGERVLVNGSSGLREGLRKEGIPAHPYKVSPVIFKKIREILETQFGITINQEREKIFDD